MGETVVVSGRFCGPPGAGNGGYVSGLLARRIGAAAEIQLRRPTPVGLPLSLQRAADGTAWALVDDIGPLVTARATRFQLDVPAAPTFAEAEAVARTSRSGCADAHPFAQCFVCGPGREHGDGLRIHPGRLAERDVWAAGWVPDASLAGDDGRVAEEFLWSALDCPGGIAAMEGNLRPMLLASIQGSIEGGVAPGEPCVVIGWSLARDGRKQEVGTALFDGLGRLAGRTRQLWIEPR